MTPTHIRSNGSSPSKRISKTIESNKFEEKEQGADELHEYYTNIIASLKRMHEEKEKQLTYKLRKLDSLGADDEYLVSTEEKYSS